MNSNWEIQKSKSLYHFNNSIIDPKWDCVEELGKFVGNWKNDVDDVIKSAKPATWRSRSKSGNPNQLIDAEENDLKNIGADVNMIISNLDYNLNPIFQKMCNIIGLSNSENRLHVQWPGQVFVKHIDKLEKFNLKDPSKIMRIMIMLTDWDQGHFNQYGNFTYQGWKSGDIHTFDWKNVPHSSANAGLTPRVSLLTTGVITNTTLDFLKISSPNNWIFLEND
jgi:hypothetical protein